MVKFALLIGLNYNNDKEYQVREQKSKKRWATMSEVEKEIKRKKERERYKKNKFLKMKN